MLGGKIKRPHYEASKFKGFEFVRTLVEGVKGGLEEGYGGVIVFETFIEARRSAG